MSTPAGWYDDGSGRQRWWDGQQWTEQYSDAQAPAVSAESPLGVTAEPQRATTPPPLSVLGLVGIGLAVVGMILVAIGNLVTVPIGLVMLTAAFVVSLIALFRKNSRKWPAIVGLILSVLGGVIGGIVLAAALFYNAVVASNLPTALPSAPTSAQPSDTPSPHETEEGRPSAEQIGEGFQQLLHQGGVTEYDDVPGFYPCLGQHFYDSSVSDESLQSIASGTDVTGAERDAVFQVGVEGTLACSSQ